jgi:hypothetical protein
MNGQPTSSGMRFGGTVRPEPHALPVAVVFSFRRWIWDSRPRCLVCGHDEQVEHMTTKRALGIEYLRCVPCCHTFKVRAIGAEVEYPNGVVGVVDPSQVRLPPPPEPSSGSELAPLTASRPLSIVSPGVANAA